MNEQVVELLDHYLDPKTPSHAAVMVTGPWGAGKTHFIKGYLAARAARLKAAEPLETLSHLYVSLYGVRSFEEVRSQFFAQTNPMLNSGPVRLLGALAARAINVATGGQGMQSDDAAAVQTFLGRSLKGLVLIFDDLERCMMPLVEIMGFINTFVEHEGAKVVILACEDEILKDNPDEREVYEGRKEKLVGKTVEVTPDAPVVYDIFVAELRHAPARAAAAASRSEALSVFAASERGNLRSLRSALQDFDRMAAALDPRLGGQQDAMERLLLFVIAVSLELRAGAVREGDVKDLGQAAHRGLFRRRGEDAETQRLDRLADVANRYPQVHWTDSVVPPEVVAAVLVRGVLDRAGADAVLREHPLVVGAAVSPSWRRIWRWFEISATEYAEVRALFLDDLTRHKIVDPGPLLHAFGTILALGDHGDDLLDGEPALDYFRRYLATIEAAGELQADITPRHDMDRSSWGGLSFAGQENEAFRTARAELDAALRRTIEAKLRAAAPELLEQLQCEENYPLLCEFGPGMEAYSVAILHNIDVEAFADLCLVDGRVNEDLVGSLLRRYHVRGRRLTAEIPWVEALRGELLRRAELEAPPRHMRLPETIRYWFGGIYKDLELPDPDAGTINAFREDD